MKYDFKDKVVIVTGASSGIGECCVQALAIRGAKVVLVARSEKKMEEIKKRLPAGDALIIPTDVGIKEQVDQMVQQVINRHKRIDILINNAGVAMKGSLATAPLDIYEQMLAVNLYGVIYGVQAVYGHMKHQGGGTIVNVSSVAGFKGFVDSALYSSTKFAVNGLSESLSQDAKKDNIDILLVCPGKVETSFEDNVLHRDVPYQAKRLGVGPEAVADAIVKGIEQEKSFIVVGKKCIPLYLLNRLSPRLTNFILKYIY